MRLICGLVTLDGAAASENLLRRMVTQMDVPRLSPALSIWLEGPIGLALLDFSADATRATLPHLHTSTIVADVRLDEPDKLQQALSERARAEDALFLAALERFGASGLDKVLGDFAFASWDSDKQRLVCGRDAFGIRPISYVYKPGELFAFASLPKALYASGIVPKKIDQDALARRMVRAYRFDDSLVAGIKRIPPGHFIEVTRESVSLGRYWQLDRSKLGTNDISPADAVRELRALVDQAVRCRLPRKGETGAHLSGGLDSSAISVFAARHLRETGRKLHAYSFLDRQRNDITVEDETEFVKAVLEQEGDIDWTPIRPPVGLPDPGEPLDADKMTSLDAEQPENKVCARAEEQGVGLILSGWGGDEGATFNGRGAFAELLLRGRWRTLAREMSALADARGWSMPRVLYGEIFSYLLPGPAISFAKRVLGREASLQSLFGRSLSHEARRRLDVIGDRSVGITADGRENRWRLMTSPHIAERAEVWAQTGARHGLAFAFPLLDRRVVEFSHSLPSELFVSGGFRRRPFRDAMIDVLPTSVRLRHQKYAPFPSRILDLAESKQAFIERIDAYEKCESVRNMIDTQHLRRQIEAFPDPEIVRGEMRGNENPNGAASMVAAAQALAAAEYLSQHADDAGVP